MDTERLLQDHLPFRTWWWLARSCHSIFAELERFFDAHGITGAQFGVLRCLADAGAEGLMLSDLSRRLMVTCGNTTGVVDRLEQAGYLRRERGVGDRRVVRARLTPQGRALLQEIMPAYQELLGSLLAALTTEEQEAVGRCCEKLHRSLAEKPCSSESPSRS